MTYYYLIQYRRLCRRIRAFGLSPLAALILVLIGYIAIATVLYARSAYAPFILILLSLQIIWSYYHDQHLSLIETIYDRHQITHIRLITHSVLMLPAVIYTSMRGDFIAALMGMLIAAISALLPIPRLQSQKIPTPFRPYAFELIRGFRRYGWLLLIVIIVLYNAIRVDNFNLAAFCLAIPFLMTMSWYSEQEDAQFVWIYQLDSRAFLIHKIQSSLIGSLILSLPLAVANIYFFSAHWWHVCVIMLIGILYVTVHLMSKYAYYPGQMPIATGFLYGFALLLPPLPILFAISFYRRAIAKLDYFLA